MTFLATFLVLSVMGAANAAYLYYEHQTKNQTLVCPLDHDCTAVTESKWSHIFFVRNELLGMVFYFTVFILALCPLLFGTDPEQIRRLLVYGTAGGVAFSVFLTGVQFFAIKDYCFYCMISAGITMLLFINSFFIIYHV